MGFLIELLADLNLSNELLAKLRDFDSEFDVLQRESVQSKIQLDALKRHVAEQEQTNQQLQRENQELRKTRELPHMDSSDIEEPKQKLLLSLFHFGSRSPGKLIRDTKLSNEEGQRHLRELEGQGHIEITTNHLKRRKCSLTEKGREYLDAHYLL